MTRGALFLGAALALVLLSGCPPTYPKCANDKDCKEHGEVCVQGQCQECSGDGNCKPGFICQAQKCVPKPECTTDSACPSGLKCKAGKCSNDCVQDDECGAGKCRNNKCVENACKNNSDCPGGQECVAGMCSTHVGKASCDWKPVHFGFNDVALDPDTRQQLNDAAECFKTQKLSKLTLEGHADERGTEEYNLQLSNRRAASVKKYLVDLGVPAAKVDTTGFGENKPVSNGHTEEAWSANRRVDFKH